MKPKRQSRFFGGLGIGFKSFEFIAHEILRYRSPVDSMHVKIKVDTSFGVIGSGVIYIWLVSCS